MIELLQLDLDRIERAREGPATFEGLVVVDGGLPPSFILDGAAVAIRDGGSPRWFAPFLFVDPQLRRIVGSGIFKGEPSDGWVEIGYGVAPSCQGRGYATGAVNALVRLACDERGVAAVYAETEVDNAASRRVVQKAGFTWTAQRRSEDHGLVDCWFVEAPLPARPGTTQGAPTPPTSAV